MVPTVEWKDGAVRLLDQSRLPEPVEFLMCRDYQTVARAIRNLKVRGAPAIGVTAAMGVALGAQTIQHPTTRHSLKAASAICDHLAATRPTAVNLFWAIERMKRAARFVGARRRISKQSSWKESQVILDEDIDLCKAMGQHGAKLDSRAGKPSSRIVMPARLRQPAMARLWASFERRGKQGKKIQVIADETRPVLQGARFTAWELMQDKIPVTLITDNMAGSLMRQGISSSLYRGG